MKSPITGNPIHGSTEWTVGEQRFRVEYDDDQARYCVRGEQGWTVLETARHFDGKFDLCTASKECRIAVRELFAKVRNFGPRPHRFELEDPMWQRYAMGLL